MISVKRTSELQLTGVNMLVYGEAGIGKTTLIASLPNPIVLSAEGGLRSIMEYDLPYIEISSSAGLTEAYNWLVGSEEAQQFDSIAVDSISEVSELVLQENLAKTKDGRQAYGDMGQFMSSHIRKLRDIKDKHFYCSAKMERTQDETGKILYWPLMAGKYLTGQMPYFFDAILAMKLIEMKQGETKGMYRCLQCHPDGIWGAKDRIGCLDMFEPPDLSVVIQKIMAGKVEEAEETGEEA